MKTLNEKDGVWYVDNVGLTHVPRTVRAEHLLNAENEVVAKRCGGICGEMLPLDSFHRCSKGFALKKSYCISCDSIRRSANFKGRDIYGNNKRPIKPKAEREYDENGVCIRKVCPNCDEWKERSEFGERNNSLDGLVSQCRKCCSEIIGDHKKANPEQYRTYRQTRRAREAALPSDLTTDQWLATMDHFGHSCALTGATEDLHLEHAVPLAIGHGGTIIWNCYPLVGSLNCSKSASNLFEWAKGRSDIDKQRFNGLISFLADQCGLTVDEYYDFYNWCFRNPRLAVEEIESDGNCDSLTLWTRKTN